MPAAVDEFEVTAGGKTVVTVPFTPAARVTGKITDQTTRKGLSGVKVTVGSRQGSDSYFKHIGEVETDASGTFTAYSPASWLSVWVSQPPAGYVAPVGQRGVNMTAPVEVAAGKSHTFPDIAMLRAVDFRGIVVFADGKPAATAVVDPGMIDRFRGDQPVITDAQGRFVLKNMRPDDILELRIRLGNAVNRLAEFDPANLTAPVTIEISEKNAARFRGLVTDQKGVPLAGARVSIGHSIRGVGLNASFGRGNTIGEVRTGPDGRFESPGLWAKDQYHFKARAEGYGEAESKQLRGDAGAVNEVPTIVLARSSVALAGTVVDLDGKPVPCATVFGVDGPTPFSTITTADGRFTLKGFYDGPAFVFAKKHDHRMTAMPVTPGGKSIVITLRSLNDPPAPAPQISPQHVAAEKELIRRLLTAIWGTRVKYGYGRHALEGMARIDLAKAKAWRDEELKRTDGKVDLSNLIDHANRQNTLFDVARKDIDEALDTLRALKGHEAFSEAFQLGKQLLAVDPKKAERLAEEAVVQARQLMLPHKVWSLAQAGELAVRAGNATGGRKVIAEAADLAEKLANDRHDGLARGMVAARLAPHDWPRAKKLLDSFKEPNDYNRYLRTAVVQLAATDLAKAKKLLQEFRPSNASYPHEARLLLAFRISKNHPDEAVAIVEGTSDAVYRVRGLVQLAGLFAATDHKRALGMIDQAFNEMEKNGEPFRGWSGFGGRAGLAAFAVYKAKELGHPDVATLVARTLAFRDHGRTAFSPKERQNEQARIALMLAMTDPAAARQILAGIVPPDQFVRLAGAESRDWLFALADPNRAIEMMDRQFAGLEKFQGGGNALSRTGLVELSSILTAPNRLRHLAIYGECFSELIEED